MVAERISWRDLWILLGGRLVFNTAFRILYPLLPLLALGFGVDLETASLLVTIQVSATLISPLGSVLAEARGELTTLRLGMGLLVVGTFVCALAERYWQFLVGYALVGFATALFIPAMQAYASRRSAYSERGRVLGFLEISWALAALVGVAGLMQLVEARESWSAAFLVLAGTGTATFALLWLLDGRKAGSGGRAGEAAAPPARPQQELAAAGARAQRVAIWAALGFITLQMFAVELVFVAYASWLIQAFAATTRQLGLVFGLLGIAELVGSLGATLLTDRIGKRRAVLSGFTLMALVVLLLPSSSGNWGLFLTLFLLFGLCFEFAIVSVFPLISGLGTGARGAVLAWGLTASAVGRIAGSLVGPRLFEGLGFTANGLVAGAAALAGVALGALLLREGRQ